MWPNKHRWKSMKSLERKKICSFRFLFGLCCFILVLLLLFAFFYFFGKKFLLQRNQYSTPGWPQNSQSSCFNLPSSELARCITAHHTIFSVAYFQHNIQLAIFLNVSRMLICFSSLSHNNPLFSHRAKARIFMRSESCLHDIPCGLSLASQIFLSVFLLQSH